MSRRFSIRVYAIIESHAGDRVVASHEFYRGIEMIKFPGGGLVWGEGVADALQRELREELGLIHYEARQLLVYEQPIISVFDPEISVIPIYYAVRPLQSYSIVNGEIHRLVELPKNKTGVSALTFENDRKAFQYYISTR